MILGEGQAANDNGSLNIVPAVSLLGYDPDEFSGMTIERLREQVRYRCSLAPLSRRLLTNAIDRMPT